jgi:hypothetical protein
LFYEWFPSVRKEQVVISDEFLRAAKYMEIMQRINQEKLKNIVIIGASHSGFSCAWLMINGPA